MTEPSLVAPLDEANQALLEQAHPPAWRNPDGDGAYDLVVLGGGTGGLVSAFGAAGLGARVALVERALLGGDCLITGCVPSKALLRSARVVGELQRAARLGVRVGPVEVDFPAVMERMRRRRAELAPNDSAGRLQAAGVDVFFGTARFADSRHVEVDGRALRFTRAIIATGGRPAVPAVSGLAETPYLTSETVFQLTERPARLLVIGAGPIGCELAQAFARFGSRVTLLDAAPQVLPREDPDAAAILERRLGADGVRCELGVRLTRVDRTASGAVTMEIARAGGSETVEGDALLVAAGRVANVDTLQAEAAGIRLDAAGVVVDDYLRTSNRRVFAVGDVCSAFRFTHVADAMARLALQNALFYGRRRMSRLTIPWCTYTDPEVAHVGLSAAGAARRDGVDTLTVPLAEVDRSVLDEETDGFLRVHHERGRLLGCTVVAPQAGELIGEASVVLTSGGTLGQLAATIHPYPTVADAFRAAGNAYRRTLLTPSARRWMTRYFRWTR